MRRGLLAVASLFILSGPIFGNVGVFFGSGHTLRLVKSADVRMVSEDVTIRPMCGPTVLMHRVEFRCVFVLKNESNKAVSIQVGFPLDSKSHLIQDDETDLVMFTHFIARDAGDTYHVRHVVGDGQNRFGHIFLWDMEFAAAETKTLHVSYILPMSYGMGTTDKRELIDPPKRTQELLPAGSSSEADDATERSDAAAIQSKANEATRNQEASQPEDDLWQMGITCCVVLGCSYITETGQSWAGPIEKATFRIENTVFEHCLRRCPVYVGGDSEDIPPGTPIPGEGRSLVEEMDVAIFGYDVGLKLGAVYPHILPNGWKPIDTSEVSSGTKDPKYEPRGIEWKFENFNPGPPLEFKYYLLGFPEKIADCDSWVRQILGKTPTKREVLELREIVAAYYGIAPKSASARRFVEQQIWFNPRSGLSETALAKPRQAILAQLEAIANQHVGKEEMIGAKFRHSGANRHDGCRWLRRDAKSRLLKMGGAQ